MENIIAVNLRNLLKIKNLTQKELAEKIETKLPVLNRWMNGKSVPSKKSMDKLSEVLDVPVSYFYTEKAENKNSSVTQAIETIKDKEIELLKRENEIFKKEIELIKNRLNNLEK